MYRPAGDDLLWKVKNITREINTQQNRNRDINFKSPSEILNS